MSTPLLPLALLAGGLGTRLGELTARIPKAMVEVNGDPFIAHQLRSLRREGVEEVVICAGHLGEAIEAYIGDGRAFDLRVRFSYDGAQLLGTAGALRKALPLLGDAFFVQYGDSLLGCDYRAVQQAFETSGRSALMTVLRNEDRWDRSNVELRDGRLVAYDKQAHSPAMRHIDYGLGVLSSKALVEYVTELPCDLAWLYQRLLADGDLAAHEVDRRFYEIGSAAGLRETAEYVATQEAPTTAPAKA